LYDTNISGRYVKTIQSILMKVKCFLEINYAYRNFGCPGKYNPDIGIGRPDFK